MKSKIFCIILILLTPTQTVNSEPISLKKLLSPPVPSLAQKCKTATKRIVASCASGFILSLIMNEGIKAIFDTLETEIQDDTNDEKFCAEVVERFGRLNELESKICGDGVVAGVVVNRNLEQTPDAHGRIDSYRKKYSFYFLLLLTTPLMYKLFTKLIKEPSWTYKQILINFISQWPQIKGSVPLTLQVDCAKLYQHFLDKKEDFVDEELAEVVVQKLVLALLLN